MKYTRNGLLAGMIAGLAMIAACSSGGSGGAAGDTIRIGDMEFEFIE